MVQSTRARYEEMRECLLGFRAGAMTLSELIDRLPAMLKEAGGPDPQWKDEFIGYWWTLEQIHGDAIDLGESRSMPKEARETVDETLDRLQGLIERAIAAAGS